MRLFTTLARFDAVYHGHFKCNRTKLTEMPVLWAYARDLFQTPGFGDTTDFVQIKSHYYEVHRDINPTRCRPGRPGPGRLGHPPRSRGPRGLAVRGRDPARATGRLGAGAGPHGPQPPPRARRPRPRPVTPGDGGGSVLGGLAREGEHLVERDPRLLGDLGVDTDGVDDAAVDE